MWAKKTALTSALEICIVRPLPLSYGRSVVTSFSLCPALRKVAVQALFLDGTVVSGRSFAVLGGAEATTYL